MSLIYGPNIENLPEQMEISTIINNSPENNENENNLDIFINNFQQEQNTYETSIEGNDNNHENTIINNVERNHLGRVRNRGKVDDNGNIIQSGKHNEYSIDNAIKKIKHLIISALLKFVNIKIKEKERIKQGIFNNILKKMSQEQIIKSKVEYNLRFLSKTIGEILSEKTSKTLEKDHNKIIINKLKEKYPDFEILFSITFYDCLKYFRGDDIEYSEYLKGFSRFSQIKNSIIIEKGEDYADFLSDFLGKYKSIIFNQRQEEIEFRKSDYFLVI